MRYVGTHAGSLASGRPLAPGDFVEVSTEDLADPYNKAMVDEGILIDPTEIPEDPPEPEPPPIPEPETKTTTKRGGSK